MDATTKGTKMTGQTQTIHINEQDLMDAAARGEGIYFSASSTIPSLSEFATMMGECQHPETFRLDEDDPHTNAKHGDIQCVECATVLGCDR